MIVGFSLVDIGLAGELRGSEGASYSRIHESEYHFNFCLASDALSSHHTRLEKMLCC
jgi:hypothetical protein